MSIMLFDKIFKQNNTYNVNIIKAKTKHYFFKLLEFNQKTSP